MPLRLILALALLFATAFGVWRLERLIVGGRAALLAERDALWQSRIAADKSAAEAAARARAATVDEAATTRILHLQALLAETESRADALARADRCGLSRDSLRALARP